MAINKIQNVQQAYVVSATERRPGQVPVTLELLNEDGTPWAPEGGEGQAPDLSEYVTLEDHLTLVARVEQLETKVEELENSDESPVED